MRVNKDWFIEKTVDIYRKRLEEALKDMPEKDFESEYEDRVEHIIYGNYAN